MEVSGQHQAPATLPRRKQSRHPENRRSNGIKGRYVRFGEEKNLWTVPRLQPRILCCPDCSLQAIPTTLPLLEHSLCIIIHTTHF